MHLRLTLLSKRLAPWLLLTLFALPSVADDGATIAINSLLDDFHQAAADADRERYLSHFAANGVFMGTDDWERWPLAEFTDYVSERFAEGTGWTYVPEARFITLGPDNVSAWFDEIVVSPRWGRFRGTGVLVKEGAAWKLAHYSLTALVPNEKFSDVSRVTTAGFNDRDASRANKEN